MSNNVKIVIAEKGDKQFNDVFESFAELYDIPVMVPNNNIQVGKIKDTYYSNGKLIGTLQIFENNKEDVSIKNIRALTPSVNFNKGKTYRNPESLKKLENVTFEKVICIADTIWADYVNKYRIDNHNNFVDRLQSIVDKDFQDLSKSDIKDLKSLIDCRLVKEQLRDKRGYVKPSDCKSKLKILEE